MTETTPNTAAGRAFCQWYAPSENSPEDDNEISKVRSAVRAIEAEAGVEAVKQARLDIAPYREALLDAVALLPPDRVTLLRDETRALLRREVGE
jgi:hypothetical protein